MEQGRNRVFINPNFNKRLISDIPLRPPTIMHVNPNFCQHTKSVQSTAKTKIYVNPNFVRPNIESNQFQYVNNNTTKAYTNRKPTPLVERSNTLATTTSIPTKHEVQSSVQIKTLTMQPIQIQSRYSLVRQKKVEEPHPHSLTIPIPKSQTTTIKINKYKSIKITDIKRNLDSIAPGEKASHFKVSNNHKSLMRTINNNKVTPKTPNIQVNRYRYVRTSARSQPEIGKTQLKRQTLTTPRKVVCSQTKIKAMGVYKKNNIPCPQFRKYGKCLRKSYGKCEFLHDRKHVSICRKFLNGVCHNDKCLLSHELSDKKMPTCYFFLKGLCTKEDCPYLHVKLNEKAKLCPDFMKGYCEKGETCLHRHVTVCSNIAVKRRQNLKKLSQLKSMKYKLEKNRNKNNTSNTQKRKSKLQILQSSSQEKDSDGRYYKDSVQESSTDQSLALIKPIRCKLGTLPSYIQL